jgi:hypothetical protein
MSLASAALVSLLAFLSPLIVRLIRLPVPDIVVQILLGIVVGPQVLGWARTDGPVRVLSLIGLSFLLFLAGLELDFAQLRGRTLRTAAYALALSFALALALGAILGAAGLVRSPLLIAVIFSATSVGIVIPILRDSGQVDTPLGRVVVAGGSLAEVIPVLLLSLLFSEQGSDLGAQITLLGAFAALVTTAALLIFGLERLRWTGRTLLALQDTTAQIRVRGAVALLMSFAARRSSFSRRSVASAMRNRSGLELSDSPRAVRSASRWTRGSFRRFPMSGASIWCTPPKGRCISLSTPTVPSTVHPAAWAASRATVRSADFPIPGSPVTISTDPRSPLAWMTEEMAATSCCRPKSSPELTATLLSVRAPDLPSLAAPVLEPSSCGSLWLESVDCVISRWGHLTAGGTAAWNGLMPPGHSPAAGCRGASYSNTADCTVQAVMVPCQLFPVSLRH